MAEQRVRYRRACSFDDPDCTGYHRNADPKAIRCPSAWAAYLERDALRRKRQPGKRGNPETIRARRPEENRRRRERATGTRIFYSVALLKWDLEDGICYICKGPLGDKPHRDHVIALAENPQPENVTISALRMACASCNLSRGCKSLPAFLLERLKLIGSPS
jgi:5-methylcytosine-specific restriction endonuclease McrA